MLVVIDIPTMLVANESLWMRMKMTTQVTIPPDDCETESTIGAGLAEELASPISSG